MKEIYCSKPLKHTKFKSLRSLIFGIKHWFFLLFMLNVTNIMKNCFLKNNLLIY